MSRRTNRPTCSRQITGIDALAGKGTDCRGKLGYGFAKPIATRIIGAVLATRRLCYGDHDRHGRLGQETTSLRGARATGNEKGITMVRANGIGRLGLFIACGTFAMATAGSADEGPFRDLTLDQARQAAADAGKRFVLVDFYTVWCGPCKKLDETTWRDQGVRNWLSKEAVCLKVDAEKDEALAAKYRINVYPTVLILRPDGSEIDRLVGYRDGKAFLADAREALAGNDSLSRARKKLEGANANDPSLRMSYGDALRRRGRPMKHSPNTSGASTTVWSMVRPSGACGPRSC